MVDAGPATWVLGMRIMADPSTRSITLNQTQYILRILDKFSMADCKPTPTPLPEKTILCAATDQEVHHTHSYPYLQVIRSVMYAMLGTRPDITYAISTLSHFASHPGSTHIQVLKHLLCYLKGSAGYGIVYSHDGGSLLGCETDSTSSISDICSFTDSDYAMDPDTHRSVSGAVFMLAGGPVSWSSRLQSTVSQSSTEAEYVTSAEAAKEAIWLRQLMRDLKQDVSLPTTLFIDNHGAQLLAKNPVNHSKMKHIDVQHHFIWECVEDGSIILHSIPSTDNIADICTKPLGKVKFSFLCSMLGVVHLDESKGHPEQGGVLKPHNAPTHDTP